MTCLGTDILNGLPNQIISGQNHVFKVNQDGFQILE